MKTTPVIALSLIIAFTASCGDDDEVAGSAGSDFCSVVDQIDEAYAVLAEEPSREQVEAATRDLPTLYDQAEASAPAEIATDVDALITLQRQQVQQVIDADYDLEAYWAGIDEADLAGFEGVEARFAVYVDENCGIDIED